MILKNKKGTKREFEILYEIEKDETKYVIYKDIMSSLIYTSKYDDNKLIPLTDEEFEYVTSVIEKMNG